MSKPHHFAGILVIIKFIIIINVVIVFLVLIELFDVYCIPSKTTLSNSWWNIQWYMADIFHSFFSFLDCFLIVIL